MRCARVKAAPDFRATLSSWRERLPNSWEPPEAWADVLGWRRAIFRRMLSGLGCVDSRPLARSLATHSHRY